MYDGGKGQEKCVLINSAGGAGVVEKKKKKMWVEICLPSSN